MHMVHDIALSSIDLNLLVILRALLRERHVTRAARQVGLSQSATSHALSRLRDLCGDPLLVRQGRTLVLTPRATQLLPGLERGLAELQGVVTSEPAFDPKRARRLFSLGMADYVQALVLPPLLRSLQQAAPAIDLNVLTFPNLSELLQSGNLDLAISVAGAIAPGLSSQVLFDDGFVCMVRKGHPLVQSKLTLERYLALRHVLVAPSGTSGSFVDSELERRGLVRRVALRVSSFLMAPVVVAETDFISTTPELLARRMAKRFALQLVPAPVQIPRFDLSLAWHPRFDDDPAHQWLRGFVSRTWKP
ncbi:MAG TPA: LysR family transcriptional regulator [Polyangiaceae bacterium]|nr:LysR family transcriptional regulator [Polyangiaceae bacterium]